MFVNQQSLGRRSRRRSAVRDAITALMLVALIALAAVLL